MELRVHLKVCEGCGCLWYRLQDELRVYCTSCNERFKDFPAPQGRKRKGRPRKITLPTVFAVHASSKTRSDRAHRTSIAANAAEAFAKEKTKVLHICASQGAAILPQPTALALLASRAAALSIASAAQGGAQ